MQRLNTDVVVNSANDAGHVRTMTVLIVGCRITADERAAPGSIHYQVGMIHVDPRIDDSGGFAPAVAIPYAVHVPGNEARFSNGKTIGQRNDAVGFDGFYGRV